MRQPRVGLPPQMPRATALVTGAASGIGAALVDALVACGVRVWATDRNADQLAAAAHAWGPSVRTHPLDVTDARAWSQLASQLNQEDIAVDLLFNNAGIGLAGEVRDLELGDWQRVLNVNVMGVVHGVHTFYPQMVARGRGHIVNTASGAGLCPRPGMVAYAAAKHAVVGLSTSLRAEAAGLGVQVSAVCPGYVATAIMDNTVWRGLDSRGLRDAIPLRAVTPQACAARVLKGVARNEAIIPVSVATHAEWLLYRLAPGAVHAVSSWRAGVFRRHRTGQAG